MLRGTREAGAAAHLLDRAPGHRAGAHRLRPASGRAQAPAHPERGGVDPEEFQALLRRSQGRYTAGVATRYAPTTCSPARRRTSTSPRDSPIGMRFHSAPVIRARRRQARAARSRRPRRRRLAHLRLCRRGGRRALRALCEFLRRAARRSGASRPADAEIDTVIDVRAVFQQGHRELEVDALPPVLLPRKGVFGLVDYEKAFCPDPKEADIFDLRGVDRRGCAGRRASRPVRGERAAAGRARGAGGLPRRRPARGVLSQRSPTMPTRMTTRVARVGSASETKSRTGAW